MSDLIDRVLCTFPPRPLADGERQLLAEWTEVVKDFSTFVSQRRSDDPAIYQRIVVSRRVTEQHLYLIHCPKDLDCWIMISAVEGKSIGHFASLRAALDYISPVMLPARAAESSSTGQSSATQFERPLPYALATIGDLQDRLDAA
jgi:hypothetical protein